MSQIHSSSIVVLAKEHNPSILNPDFLRSNEIVPAAWGWEVAQPPFTTPAVSQVVYSSKLSIVVESGKLSITSAERDEPTKSRLADVASKYLKVLCHVPYTAVGINFRTAEANAKPDEFVKTTYLRGGPWDTGGRPLKSASVKFVYAIDEFAVTVSVEPGEADQEPAVVLQGNFHLALAGAENVCDRAVSAIGKLGQCWRHFGELEKAVVGAK